MYWTGISQPPNSMSLAPSCFVRCEAERRLRAWRLRRRSRRRSSAGSVQAEPGACGDQRALGLERQDRARLVERDPADLVELVVVARRGRRRPAPSGSSGRSCGSACRIGRSRTRSSRARPAIRHCRPVSSRHLAQGRLLGRSRRGSGCPSAASRSDRHARAAGFRRRTTGVRPRERTTIPPAEVAVEPLSRATAPERRSERLTVPGRPLLAHRIADALAGGPRRSRSGRSLG